MTPVDSNPTPESRPTDEARGAILDYEPDRRRRRTFRTHIIWIAVGGAVTVGLYILMLYFVGLLSAL